MWWLEGFQIIAHEGEKRCGGSRLFEKNISSLLVKCLLEMCYTKLVSDNRI